MTAELNLLQPPLIDKLLPKTSRFPVGIAVLTMLLTLIPYLIGYNQSSGRQYMWLAYNLDDSCVYLSWMRQAAEGSYRALNLFTTDPQSGMELNPLFLLMGLFARITHLPLLAIYHMARIITGFLLLIAVWKFIRLVVLSERARKLAFLFVCFSSGLGWLFFWEGSVRTPIDTWQPEAITFLSLYLSPLFCFSMLLQVGIVYFLLKGERYGNNRFAVYAGVLGFVLGLVHTYDVITMSTVWIVYLLFNLIKPLHNSKRTIKPWIQAAIAGIITFPAVAYIAYELKHEAVFQARANVETLAQPITTYLTGYGLTLILAITGAYVLIRHNKIKGNAAASSNSLAEVTTIMVGETADDAANKSDTSIGIESIDTYRSSGSDAVRLLIIWAVVNITVSYLPVAFQRKMLQGAHFPIAILAGIGAAWILEHFKIFQSRRNFTFAASLITFFLSLTNLWFVLRDLDNANANTAQTHIHRPYLQTGEIEALMWFSSNTPPGTPVQPLPWIISPAPRKIAAYDMSIACFTPGIAFRPVYCGHWGETPDFKGKLSELTHFCLAKTSDDERIALLHKMKVRYLLFSQKTSTDPSFEIGHQTDHLIPIFRGQTTVPHYLQLVYTNSDADIYEVRL